MKNVGVAAPTLQEWCESDADLSGKKIEDHVHSAWSFMCDMYFVLLLVYGDVSLQPLAWIIVLYTF